jgi:nucleoside-diphosphate-sugar epimerase
MNIAITDGLGFIGSNLAIELLKQGANIEIYNINIHKNIRYNRI